MRITQVNAIKTWEQSEFDRNMQGTLSNTIYRKSYPKSNFFGLKVSFFANASSRYDPNERCFSTPQQTGIDTALMKNF